MEEKIRLAVFGQKRLSREGGIEIVVKELCTRMAQNGCDVTCYNRAGHHVSGAEYDKTIEYDGIRQKVVPTIEKKGLAAVSSSFFAALYSAFGRYDVVHIHAEGPAFFCWIPKLFGKRVISTIHGLDWAREKWKFGVGSKFIRQGEKNAVKYADEIIVLSKDVQKYFLETYGRETHFIPNGVNRPEVREAKLITDHFGLEKDSYILFLGRLVPEKGIRYLVEAFKNVKTDKKLVIAGGSSDTDFKETYGRETHFIPNGVNRPQIREASLITDKFGLKKDSYILFLGRLVPEKGIRYLVEAFKNVKTDKKLVIAGGSSDTDSFMSLCILFRTLLNRNLWMNPLSDAMGGWGIWETVNGEQKLTTECIENVIMMVPFSAVVMWTFREKIGNGWKKILWQSGKITFIFSISIEMLQLLLRLGTFQLSDIFYNTVGGVLGGLLYCVVMKVRKRL